MKKIKIVAVSGGFDPIHVGHLRMFRKARELGDKLVVILNNDNWLNDKKGFVFMTQKERAEIISALPFVDDVLITSHVRHDTDKSVCRELSRIKPAIFANGGDRKTKKKIPEAELCEQLNIKMMFNIGGGKVQSSSRLAQRVRQKADV